MASASAGYALEMETGALLLGDIAPRFLSYVRQLVAFLQTTPLQMLCNLQPKALLIPQTV